jgi:hypothetical protein
MQATPLGASLAKCWGRDELLKSQLVAQRPEEGVGADTGWGQSVGDAKQGALHRLASRIAYPRRPSRLSSRPYRRRNMT